MTMCESNKNILAMHYLFCGLAHSTFGFLFTPHYADLACMVRVLISESIYSLINLTKSKFVTLKTLNIFLRYF